MFPIKTKATKIEITDKLSKYLDTKLAQVARIIPKKAKDVTCAVELEKITKHHKAGKVYRAEINVRVEGILFRSEATEESIEEAIDYAKNEMKEEIKKNGDRAKTQRRKGGKMVKDMMMRSR